MLIIASDFDGTICRVYGDEYCISEKDRNAIQCWQQEGNRFGIVTGRGSELFDEESVQMIKLDYAVVYNGALIMDGNRNVIAEEYISRELAEDYAAFIRQFPGLEECEFGFACRDPKAAPTDGNIKGVYQIFTGGNVQEEVDRAVALCNEHYGDTIITYKNGDCINAVKRGVSKATGIRAYMRAVGCTEREVFSVGDNYNDLPMLYAFDGYVVNTADKEIRDLIPNHCEDMDDLMMQAKKRYSGGC